MGYRVIPGNGLYEISLDLKIRRVDGGVCDLDINEDDEKVSIELFDEIIEADLTWIMLISWYDLYTKEMVDLAVFGKSVSKITDNKVGYWILFKRQIEVADGFRVIPTNTRYCVSKDGEVRKIDSWKRILGRKYSDKQPYPTISVYCPIANDPQLTTKVIHRLVAAAWVKNNDPYLNDLVDHIDDDKENYHSSNLRWVTNRINMLSAISKGTKQTIRVTVRDVLEDKVMQAYSISNACAIMGISSSNLSGSISIRREGLIANRYEIRYADDTTPWAWSKDDLPVVNSRYTINIELHDGSTRTIEGGIEFKRFVNKYFKRTLPNGVIELAEILRTSELVKSVAVLDRDQSTECQARCEESGKVLEGRTFSDLARKTNIHKTSVLRYSRMGPERVFRGFRFRLKSDLPWPDRAHN